MQLITLSISKGQLFDSKQGSNTKIQSNRYGEEEEEKFTRSELSDNKNIYNPILSLQSPIVGDRNLIQQTVELSTIYQHVKQDIQSQFN